MYEVIIERPRTGGGWGGKGRRAEMRRRADPETAPYAEPISRGRGSKHLNENLAPLRRFLLSRVGRPWDAVHAEIAATLRVTSAVQKHVLDHLRDMVYTHVMKAGDRLYERGSWGVREIDGRRWAPVYVCPETGLLKKVPRRPARYKPPVARDVVPIDSGAQYRKIGGQWYRITLAPIPADPSWLEQHDVLLGPLRSLGTTWQMASLLREHYGRTDRYATEKRQIGKKELRRLPPEVG
ncbi:hypothetical protein SAMN02745121_01370 [Nannocystis exedens]|uniref:Uncharacterized protein n=1 Tax=Nannocystis exedens TaxID=54 RepID=A0A1I1UX82_9BACT|nr:hypothetical protein [Nannocystis exedens]PCC72161.1 hypothetical protein NAEX_05240 [Nannocystis exedens]SFD75304.1 hypothetical protein SAMN02745121_01370 [Nannocystis exedens]